MVQRELAGIVEEDGVVEMHFTFDNAFPPFADTCELGGSGRKGEEYVQYSDNDFGRQAIHGNVQKS